MIGLRLRLLMLMLMSVLVLGGVGGIGGCVESEGVDSDDGWVEQVSAITESMTGAELRVEVGPTGIDVAGAVRVRVLMAWKPGVDVELIEPDWEEFGWTVGGEDRSEILFDGEGFERVVEFELWPYLPGVYEVPSVGIRASSEAAGKRIARVSGVEVEVASVLDESDVGELDGVVGLVDEFVVAEESNRAGWIWFGLAGLLVVCGGLSVWSRGRRGLGDEGLDACAIIEMGGEASELSDEELGELHRAIVELSGEYSELGDLAGEIEAIRFSGVAVDQERAWDVARRAALVCGVGR